MPVLKNGFTKRTKRRPTSYAHAVTGVTGVIIMMAMFHMNYLQLAIDGGGNFTVSEAAISEAAITITDGAIDKEAIKASRKAINKSDSCNKKDADAVINRVTSEMFTRVPTQTDQIDEHSPRLDIRKCKNVILDFGANVGDTLNHVVDSGLPTCAGELHLDLHKRTVGPDKWNRVTKFLQGMMKNTNHSPEDYCYYGVEGNPHFTERLQGLEDYIHSINPKPVEHAAFFTESVGTGEVGMTKLFLDTVNTKQNFWGSSIMKGHQDVTKSITAGEAPYHDVMGYTITKIMDMTLKGLDENATEEDKTGGHLLLKVDIEGGEYALTQEVVASKALCNYVAMGNTANVIIETHSQRVTGPNPLIHKFKKWREELIGCGVKWQTLQAHWN